MLSLSLVMVLCVQHVNSMELTASLNDILGFYDMIENRCLTEDKKTNPVISLTNRVVCPAELDSYWHCWKEVEAGTEVENVCNFFFYQNVTITRRCFSNGTWEPVKPIVALSCPRLSNEIFNERRTKYLGSFISSHLCNTNGSVCDQKCIILGEDKYRCDCDENFILDTDGKSCKKDEATSTGEGYSDCAHEIGVCVEFKNNKPMPREDGNYRHPGSPHCFIQCVNGLPYCQCCHPKKLYYVERCNQCLKDQTQSCYYSKETLATIQPDLAKSGSSCTEEKATKRCNSDFRQVGNFPAEMKEEFITCVKGMLDYKGYCTRCPGNLVWAAETATTGTCQWPK